MIKASGNFRLLWLRITIAAILSIAPFAVPAADTALQPISARFAQMQENNSIELITYSFTDIVLQEADRFDGWTAITEVVIPMEPSDKRKQIRLSLPIYTDGDARVTDSSKPDDGSDIDIDAAGGVFDFATIQWEFELSKFQESAYNSAYSIGFGLVLVPLNTSTVDDDLFNHEGYIFLAGYRYDRPVTLFGSKSNLLLNGGIRFYFSTDDLIQDTFTWADLKGAIVFDSISENWVPVFELTYLGEFGEYDELLFKPEVIFPLGKSAGLKLGAILSLTDDGNQDGFTASLAYNF